MGTTSRKKWIVISICLIAASAGIVLWTYWYWLFPSRNGDEETAPHRVWNALFPPKTLSEQLYPHYAAGLNPHPPGPAPEYHAEVVKAAREQEEKEEQESVDRASGGRPVDCSVLPYTGTTPPAQVDNAAGGQDIRGGMDCHFLVSDKVPIFTLHFIGRPNNTLGDIEVLQAGRLIQTITGHEVDQDALYPALLESAAQSVDANFDGYQDLELLSDCGATGNCDYDFYLYDPAENKFVRDKFLNGLTSPTFDATKKQIITGSNSSAVDWTTSTYEFRNGKYVEIEREVSSESGKKTYELKDGKMVLTDSEKRDDL